MPKLRGNRARRNKFVRNKGYWQKECYPQAEEPPDQSAEAHTSDNKITPLPDLIASLKKHIAAGKTTKLKCED